MADTRQANFRLDQETADNFRKFCEENGYSQAEGFDYLMQLLAMDRTAASAPGRKTEIESFKKSIESITQTYLASVDLCTDTESRIRSQYDAALASKDSTIVDLQDKVKGLEAAREQAVSVAEASAKAAAQAVKDESAAHKQAETAERLCTEKDETIANLKSKVIDYDDLKKNYTDAQERLTEMAAEIAELRRSAEEHKRDAEIALSNAVMAKEREYLDKMREADIDKQNKLTEMHAEIEALRLSAENQKRDSELALANAVMEKEREYMDKLREADLNAQTKLREADKENARLQAEISILREQLGQVRNPD